MRCAQEQLGTWEPSQHLLEDRGKPSKPARRLPVAGHSGYIVTPSQEPGKWRLQKSPVVRPTSVLLIYWYHKHKHILGRDCSRNGRDKNKFCKNGFLFQNL
jgi:hypothetical protein